MRRKLGLWLAVAVGSCTLGLFVHRLRNGERAAELSQHAERLLHAPFEAAPAFTDLRAAEARELLEQAEELSSSPVSRALLAEARAIERLQAQDPAGARAALSGVVAEAPGALRVLRAAIELADKHVAPAAALLEPALAGGSEDPRAWGIASDIARAQGRADRAIELANRGLGLQPSSALYERRGLAHELAGDLNAAKADFGRAAQLDPNSASPLMHLGRVSRAIGDMRGAVLAFAGAAQRNPNDAEAWLGSGVCRSAIGDRAGARNDLERAEQLAPKRVEPLIALGDLDVAEGNLADAARHYRIATQLRPELALAFLKLGNTLLRQGPAQLDPAIAAFRSAIERNPELAAAHNGLGAALHARGDTEQAVRELQLAAKLDPRDPNPLLNLARVHRRNGDRAGADLAIAQARARESSAR